MGINIDKEKMVYTVLDVTGKPSRLRNKVASKIPNISISSLKGHISKPSFDDLKKNLPKLKSKSAKANAILAVCVATAAGVGATGVDNSKKKKDSTSLKKLQKAMISSIGGIYDVDHDFIQQVNKIMIDKMDITTKLGKKITELLSKREIIRHQDMIVDAIIAGTITFITGKISIAVFDKINKGEIDPSESEILQFVTEKYDKLSNKTLNKLLDAIKKIDPEKILDNLIDLLSETTEEEKDSTESKTAKKKK